MSLRVFILEDDARRINGFKQALAGAEDVTICRDIDQALAEFSGPYDVVFLDHDLGDHVYMDTSHRNTGSEFVRQKGKELRGAVVVIHSWNEPGARAMEDALRFECDVVDVHRAPFGVGVLSYARQLTAQAA